MNKYVAEFIGTFFLVLTMGSTVIDHGAGLLAPLAIGSALMVMIFAGGHISGGHFNPAVTLGVWLRGKCEAKDVAPYMIFQILGAALAALAVKFFKEGAAVEPLHPATVSARGCLFRRLDVRTAPSLGVENGNSRLPRIVEESHGEGAFLWRQPKDAIVFVRPDHAIRLKVPYPIADMGNALGFFEPGFAFL